MYLVNTYIFKTMRMDKIVFEFMKITIEMIILSIREI